MNKTEMPKKMPKIHKKTWLLHYKILLAIKKHGYASKIARQMNLKRTSTDYHINTLLSIGYIRLEVYTSAKLYVLTEKGEDYIKNFKMPKFSLPTKKVRLHTMRINFPILEDNPNAKFEKVNNDFKNWIPKYITVTFPIGITIQKTPKSIVAIFHEYETDRQTCITDFFSWVMRGSYYVYYYLMNRMKIRIDIFNGVIKQQHIANEELKNARIDEKQTTTMALGRKAKTLLGDAPFDANAWVDFSKGNERGIMDIETDDMLYQERLIMMPEYVNTLRQVVPPMVNDIRREINLHLEIQRETLKGQREDRAIRRETLKLLKELRGKHG